jgi:anti-sigma B factor antagonist
MSRRSGQRHLLLQTGIPARERFPSREPDSGQREEALRRGRQASKLEFDFDAISRHGHCLLQWEDHGEVSVVHLDLGRHWWDERHLEPVAAELDRLTESAGRRHLVLDMGRVEGLSGLAIGKIVRLWKRLRLAGGGLALCNLTPTVEVLFQALRLDRIFTIRASAEEAVASFS